MNHARALLAIPALTLLFSGCGDKLGYSLVPVKGVVRLDGQPLPGAHIEFVPAGNTPGIGSSGAAGPDGAYLIHNKHGGAGAAPGEYKVVVNMPEARGGAVVADPKLAKAASDKRVPPLYASRDTTPLRATVPARGGVVDLELSSKPAATQPRRGDSQ